jgi:hypothetical protein
MSQPEQTPAQWFGEAARHYVEGHQGCVWCGGVNCVYRSQRDGRLEYDCSECDFFACFDPQVERYVVSPGHPLTDCRLQIADCRLPAEPTSPGGQS